MTNQEKLYNKVTKELKDFTDELEQMTGKEVLQKAFEYVAKTDIYSEIECGVYEEISDTNCEYLMGLDNLLDAIYTEYLGLDLQGIAEDLRCCITDMITRMEE